MVPWGFRRTLKPWRSVFRLRYMMIGLVDFLVDCSLGSGGLPPFLRFRASSCLMWKRARSLQHLKGPRGASFLSMAKCGLCTAPTATFKYGMFRPGAGFGRLYCGQSSVYLPPLSFVRG